MLNVKVIAVTLSAITIAVIAFFALKKEPQSPIQIPLPTINIEPKVTTNIVERDIITTVVEIDEAETGRAPQEPEIPKPVIVNPPPTLDGSDAQVLLAIADLSPTLSQWLIP